MLFLKLFVGRHKWVSLSLCSSLAWSTCPWWPHASHHCLHHLWTWKPSRTPTKCTHSFRRHSRHWGHSWHTSHSRHSRHSRHPWHPWHPTHVSSSESSKGSEWIIRSSLSSEDLLKLLSSFLEFFRLEQVFERFHTLLVHVRGHEWESGRKLVWLFEVF